jgi:hypothetical protein
LSAAVADATEADRVTTELLLDAVTDAWMQNFPAVIEVCFTNHLAAAHAKVAASYKPLAHARQGLVIFGHYLIWRGKTVYDLIVHDKSRPFATANQSSACIFGLVASLHPPG